jgi:Ca-activated chloride channel family protein
MLLLLALPVLLAVWECTRRGNPLVLPFDHAKPRPRKFLRSVVTAFNLLPALMLALVILILAGPQRLMDTDDKRVLANIQLVLDCSGSMESQYGGPGQSRYDGAMDAIKEFTTYRKDDAFGLTIFGNEVMHWVPLTKDTSAIRLATPFLRPEKLPPYFGGTEIGKALREAQKVLAARPEGDRMIILLTDGQSADLGGSEANNVANELRAANITVFTIHVAEGGAPDDMYTIAGITGGSVFAAGDPTALKEVFHKIDQMRPAKLKPSAPQYADFFWPLAITGLALAGLHLLGLSGVRYTPW